MTAHPFYFTSNVCHKQVQQHWSIRIEADRLRTVDPVIMNERFYIVAIGVSQGGQLGILEFLQVLPTESNLAFVVVSDSHSNFDEVMPRFPAVHLAPIEHGARIEKNRLYIAPKNYLLSVKDGCFRLDPQEDIEGNIDFFFTSLAHEVGDRAIGVVLSKTGHEGFAGLTEIDKYGGKILIQSRSYAPFGTGLLPMATLDAVHPTLVASPATLALYLTSFALFNEPRRPHSEHLADN